MFSFCLPDNLASTLCSANGTTYIGSLLHLLSLGCHSVVVTVLSTKLAYVNPSQYCYVLGSGNYG